MSVNVFAGSSCPESVQEVTFRFILKSCMQSSEIVCPSCLSRAQPLLKLTIPTASKGAASFSESPYNMWVDSDAASPLERLADRKDYIRLSGLTK